VMIIRTVHPQVDEIGGGPEHTRQVRPLVLSSPVNAAKES
jgi:hypothetical protein